MLLGRDCALLVAQHLERVDQARACFMRLNHVVYITGRCRDIWIGKACAIVRHKFGLARDRILRLGQLAPEDDAHRALRPHDRNLGAGPGQHHVGPDVARVHYAVGPAIRLAHNDCELGHGRLAEGVEQFGAVANDAAMLLVNPRHEAWHILKHNQRDVKGVAKTNETRALLAGFGVEHACEHLRLLRHKAHHMAAQARKAHQQVLRIILMHLHPLPLVHNTAHDNLHVVRLVGVVGHNRVQIMRLAQRVILGRDRRCVLHVVAGQIADKVLHQKERVLLALGGKVGHARLAGVHQCAPQFLKGDILVRHRLDHVRPGHKHVARVLDHDHKVGDGRAVDRPARTRPHDDADLRNDARRQRVAVEDLGIARQAVHAFLNARPARVVQTDHGRAIGHGRIHHLADLHRVRVAYAAAEDRKILRVDVDKAAVNCTVARHHTITGDALLSQPKVVRIVRDKDVHFAEATLVEQQFQPLARRHAAACLLFGQLLGAASLACSGLARAQVGNTGIDRFTFHGRVPSFLYGDARRAAGQLLSTQ